MPLVNQAVQACHAGIAAGRDLIEAVQPYLVLATVPKQSDLIALSCKLSANGVEHRVFHEEDMGGRPTALGTGVVTKAQRKLFRDLKLYGKGVDSRESISA